MRFTRGDTYCFKFQRKDNNGDVITAKADKVFFTVKSNYETDSKAIQKTLDDGITFDEDGTYHVIIKNEDTRNMAYGDYVYDIQVITDEYVKTISKGDFILEKEVTFEYE